MAVQEMTRRRCGGAGHAPVPLPGTVDEHPQRDGGAAEALLHGRDAELKALAGRISRLSEGHGGVLLIEGDAGAGKSRFAREARTIAEAFPIRVLSATGDRNRQGVPFGALIEALVSDGRPVLERGLLQTLAESAEQGFWLLRAMQVQLERAASDRPLLVVIDDLHWCDAGTLLVLRTLPARSSSHPILWLVTVRTGPPGADVRATVSSLADSGAQTMRLARLPDDVVASMAHDLSHASVQRQLGRLSPAAQEVLRSAAVLGRDLEAGRLADLGGHTIAEIVAALQEAIDADLVRPTDPLRFRNDIVREAIRGTVPASQRRTLRKRAADLSLAQGAPIGQVALAMAETAEPGDPEAAALLRRALTQLAQVSPDIAAPIARQAVALAPAGSAERADAVADAIPLLARIGRCGEGRALAEAVLDGPLPAAVEARVRLGAAMSAMSGSFAEVLRHSRSGTGLDGVPDDLRAPLTALRCLATLVTGDAPAAERLLAPSTETALRAGDHAALALLRTTDSWARALRLDFAAAERLAAEAVASVPDSSEVFFPAVWRASLHGMTGRLEEGLHETADGVAASRRPGHAQGLNLWLAAGARLLLAAGRLAEARAEAEAALAEPGVGDATSFDPLTVIERVGALTGDPAALESADASKTAIKAGACGPPVWPADDPALVRTALRTGRTGDASAVVTTAERRAALNPDVPFFAAIAAHARGLLNEDAEAVRRAIEILDQTSGPLSLASALEDAGRMLLESDRDAAIRHLTQAESIYARTGAENEVARVRRRLGPAGRRTKRRPPAQGWDALTPAEHRVASLVAGGATNRQAAEQLFLSPATVGTHVMNVFRKLGVNSRVELARVYLERVG